MMNHFKVWPKLSLFVMVLLIIACATVPLTNRRQLNIIPSGELLSMSYQQYDDVKKSSKLSTNQAQTAMVKRVGKRIAAATEEFLKENKLPANYDWEFILIEDDKTVNAWCMPGGKVAFYSGILPYTKNEAGIAVVMGHEIAHAIAQHGNERMSQGLLVQFGGMALSLALKEKPQLTQQLWMSAFGFGAQVGLMLPFSRKHEYEADRIGLTLMAKAGFNPQHAIDFWQRMSQGGGAKPPEFLSTHPSDVKRVAALKKSLPEAMKYYKK